LKAREKAIEIVSNTSVSNLWKKVIEEKDDGLMLEVALALSIKKSKGTELRMLFDSIERLQDHLLILSFFAMTQNPKVVEHVSPIDQYLSTFIINIVQVSPNFL